MLGNFLVKDFVAIFGSKRSLFVSICLYVTGSLCFIYSERLFGFFVGALLLGMNDQLIYVILKIIMNDLFGDHFTHYLPICYAGYACSPLIWPNIASLIVNPHNEKPTDTFYEENEQVQYFGKHIVANFDKFLRIQLAIHVILLTSISMFMPKSSRSPSKLSQIFGYAMKGDYKRASVIFRESKMNVSKRVNKTLRQSLKNLSRNASFVSIKKTIKLASDQRVSANDLRSGFIEKPNEPEKIPDYLLETPRMNKDFQMALSDDAVEMKEKKEREPSINFEDLQKGQLVYINNESEVPALNPEDKELNTRLLKVTEYEYQQKVMESYIIKDLFSYLFLSLLVAGTIRTTTARYFFSNFKIMGLYYFDDDKLINTLGSIAYTGYITVSFTFGHIFDHLGLKMGYFLMLGGFVLGHLFYAFFAESIVAYFALSILHRVS